MAKLRLEGEWKLWAGIAALFIVIAVYLYMASRPPMEGGEYLWNVAKVIDSRNLSLKGSGEVIQFRLTGLLVPPSQEEAAREFLSKTLLNNWVRIKTLRQEPKGVKEGFVLLSGDDINARMVRQGLAQIDREEKDFDIRPYIELEQEAKRQRRGLWRESGPGVK
ncbi:MAG: thermonuclease family protein [Desulfomonile tiedjei]|nr:thermonuclease family protein [Desulfomonile tiedjei]